MSAVPHGALVGGGGVVLHVPVLIDFPVGTTDGVISLSGTVHLKQVLAEFGLRDGSACERH